MMKNSLLAFALPLTLLSCDRSGESLVPDPNGDFQSVLEIGELAIMSSANLTSLTNAVLSGTSPQQWCKDNLVDGKQQCYFSILGQAPNGIKGGATLTFKGNGGPVCLIVDPEAVFWNTAVAADNPDREYRYADVEEDDGDIDLFAGLSTYYMGSPGIEIGDFNGVYTDSLGSMVEIEYNECTQVSQYDVTNAHAGRATPEYCTISTANREDVEYTAVLESFSIPLDDGALGFGAIVLEGACTQLEINECTLFGESQKAERDSSGAVVKDENGLIKPFTKACTKQLERASCTDKLTEFCCIYPEMCGEDAKEFACLGVSETASEICTAGHELNYLCCGSE